MSGTQNIIAIKRSQTTAEPPALANGEIAYSFSSNKFFIGTTATAQSAVSVTYIGGKLVVDKVANLESRLAGAGDIEVNNATITSNANIETLKLTNFELNGMLYTGADGVVDFVTGTSGKVLQISANGAPTFDDINGGTF